jgi:hypothetical protein
MRKLLAVVTVAASLLATDLVQQETTASAWVYGRTSGVIGQVYAPRGAFVAQNLGYVPPGIPMWALLATTDGPLTVVRAPRRGRQQIVVAYVLQLWDGTRWVTHSSQAYQGTIGRRQRSIQFRQPAFYPQRPRGYWRMTYGVTWMRWGQTLGAAVVTGNRVADHYCTDITYNEQWHPAIACTLYNGYVYVHRVGPVG